MNSDFQDAHERHWEDAELLMANSRLANADHLYGMSAECGLKCLMIPFGMMLEADGTGTPENKVDKVHADKIWDRFESYRSGHHAGTAYVLPLSNPFTDWNVSQRYAPRSDFNQAQVKMHRTGAEMIRKLIAKAQKDGLL